MLDGIERRLGAVVHLELGQNGADIAFDGSFRQAEGGGNGPIAATLNDEAQHILFTLGQLLERRKGYLMDQGALRSRMQRGFAAYGSANGLQKVRLEHIF